MNVQTYDLTIIQYYNTIEYRNISRVAVKRYIEWHKESIGYVESFYMPSEKSKGKRKNSA